MTTDSGVTTTWDQNQTVTTEPPTEETTVPATTAKPPQVGDEKWYLYVKKDPSTDDMKFPEKYPGTATNVSMHQETNPSDAEAVYGHDGKYKKRKFWYRKTVPYDGGENLLVTEVVSSSYVQANVGSNGIVPDDDLHSTIEVTDAKCRAAVLANPYFESTILLMWYMENVFGAAQDYSNLGLKAHKSSTIKAGQITIAQDTGNVLYSPSQIVPDTLNDAYEDGFWATDYILAAIAAITPRFVVSISAGVGPQDEVAYVAGVSGTLEAGTSKAETSPVAKAGIGASLTVTWQNSSINSNLSMQWTIHRAAKTCIAINADGSAVWGPAYDKGVAVESNTVTVVGQTLGNPENVR